MMQRQKQENEQAAKDQVIPIITIENPTMANGRRNLLIIPIYKLPSYKNRFWLPILKIWRFIFPKKRQITTTGNNLRNNANKRLEINAG
uniref:Uncharacterized protein n=1 Tax=Romanomermis culicivorax TaxID=13658 RepID=A0A915JK60_ROMCU